jgi:hypothetical protein
MEYRKGANDGAPDAIQVADRWHLLTNLRDALKRMLEGKRACLKAAAEKDETQDGSHGCKQEHVSATDIQPHSTSAESYTDKHTQKDQVDTTQKLTKAEQEKQARHARRQERYETVLELYDQGISKREIARRLKLHRRTISKYIKADECPMYPEGVKRGSKLDPYMSYIQQRWEAGCHNATQIWRELRQLGFHGSRGLVARWAANERT